MKSNIPQNCLSIIKDRSKPPAVRAEFLVLLANEAGIDLVKPVAQIIERLDREEELEKQVAALAARVEASEKSARPLQPEIFFREITWLEAPAALVLCTSGFLICPLERKLDGVRCGDFVFIDRSSGKVVAKDGAIRPTGEIVRVEEVPGDGGDQAVVRLRDERITAYLSDDVRSSPDLRPGVEAVFDSQRRFVHRLIVPKVAGDDLLAPASELASFTIDSLGSPNPVIKKILRLVKRDLFHPEWQQAMGARKKRSYLFFGPSGSGKTIHIKSLVGEIAALVEELTGERAPRVVFCDAASFYSPYFGESEGKIKAFFRKIAALARKEIVAKDGRRLRIPLVVVFEEIDGIVRQRGEFGGSSHLYDRTLSLILQEMDDASNRLDVPLIFISTTNKKELLDFAARRRFAQREAYFGTLDARAALAVLEKKVPEEMPIHSRHGADPASARRDLLRSVIFYLFGEGEDCVVAEAVLRDSSRRAIRRRDLVTGALLEMAVSEAIDETLDAATDRGELIGLEAAGIIESLSRQFEALATGFRPHNIRDHAPHLFMEEEALLAGVRPRHRAARRPAAQFVS